MSKRAGTTAAASCPDASLSADGPMIWTETAAGQQVKVVWLRTAMCAPPGNGAKWKPVAAVVPIGVAASSVTITQFDQPPAATAPPPDAASARRLKVPMNPQRAVV